MTLEEVWNFIEAGNFFLVPNNIMECDISPTAFMVFFYLCRCSDVFGTCSPSRETIGKNCGDISVVTVDKALNELIEWGMIKKYRNFKDHIQQPNDYIIQDLKHRDFKFYLVKKAISEGDFH